MAIQEQENPQVYMQLTVGWPGWGELSRPKRIDVCFRERASDRPWSQMGRQRPVRDQGCIGVGTYGVFGAFAKGAPLRVIGNSMTGAHDLYWYAKADGPIRTMRDASGKTVAYSTNGSSTNIVVLGLQRTLDVKFQPVATGSPASTFTQVMSGQVDVGWASPPFGVEAVQAGRIRIVARGSDVPSLADQSVRVMIANAGVLTRRADAISRFMLAYRESIDWMYADPAALDAYGAWAGVTAALAKRVRDEFYPKANLEPDHVTGLDALMADAVVYKYLPATLRPDQIKTLIQLQQT